MELQLDMGHVESHFGLFGCKIGTKGSKKSFWTNPVVLLGDKAQQEACFGPFGGSANLDAR
jgi:hypothetical protein